MSELPVALARAVKASGRSMAELVREGIALVTRSYGAPDARLPLFEGPGTPVSDDDLQGFGES